MKNIVRPVLWLVAVFAAGCNKEPFPGRVTIVSVKEVTHNSMVIRSRISGTEGGVDLLYKGVCLDKTQMPVSGQTQFEGVDVSRSGDEAITGVAGLDPGTRYIVRAYFETSVGMVFSEPLTVPTQPVEYLTDPRDGRKYEIILYGDQYWMVQNLGYATPGSLVFENRESNGTLFGRLYPYEEAVIACPPGWRLPTDEEWKKLESFIGVVPGDLDKTVQRGSPFGGMMKEPGIRLWESSNALHANNHSGFSVVPSGWFHSVLEQFSYAKFYAQFWTQSADSQNVYTRFFYADSDEISRLGIEAGKYKLSVRCIK